MSQESPDPQTLLLKNARLVLPDAVTEPTNVFVTGSRIAQIGAAGQYSTARTLDLDGHTIYPGFIDVHIHGAVGVDALAATADDLQRVAVFLASRGVTAWLPTLVPAPAADYRRAAAAVEALMRRQSDEEASRRDDEASRHEGDAAPSPARRRGARALGIHYEGPFVNTARCGALRTEYFRTYRDASSLDELAALPRDIKSFGDERAAHVITVAPEIEGGVALVRELSARGWVVSIGHTRAAVETLDAARDAGARHMTHFFNAMSPLHHRDPGVVGWGLLEDRVTCDVIADGVHSDPLMLRLALRCKTPARLALISDAVLPAGLGDGDFNVWGETISVVQGRTRNARGSIAGSVITMLDAARMMLSLGCAPHEIARMASHNPARLLGLDHLTGSIEEGKRADLVAIDVDGRARLTLVGGRVAFDGRSER